MQAAWETRATYDEESLRMVLDAFDRWENGCAFAYIAIQAAADCHLGKAEDLRSRARTLDAQEMTERMQ